MKSKNLVLPHPVLGQGDDINGISGFRGEPSIKISEDSYDIEFEIIVENGTILDLVNADKAIYCCEVLCPGTLYREIYYSSSLRFKFEIPRTFLKNRVDFQAKCIATKSILNYNNPAFHADFEGFMFDLEKADVIATFGTFNFNADIQYNKLKAASTFMQIVPNEPGRQMTEYVLDDSKIQIKLPPELYEKYKFFGNRREFAPIIHASLVQTALTIALFNFKEHVERGDIWALSILHRLENEPELNNGSGQIDNSKVPEIVQKLLGNPNERMIIQLEKLSSRGEI